MNEQTIPHNVEAEQAVLGSLLIDQAQWDGLQLDSGDFFIDAHRILFSAMQSLNQAGKPADQISVAQELASRKQVQAVGGVAIFPHLSNKVPTSMHCHHYAEIVRRLSAYRKMLDVAGNIAKIAYEAPGDLDESLRQADQLLINLRKNHSRPDVLSPRDRADTMTERYAQLADITTPIAVPTGIHDLDYTLGGGFFPGELCLLAAATGMGKSELARNISNNVGKRGPVLFCSAEMTVEGHTDRDIAEITGIDVNAIRRGGYDGPVKEHIVKAVADLAERNVHLYPDARGMRAGITVSGIATAADEVQARHGPLKLIVVDYLQRLRSPGSREKRYQELGDMTSALADLGKSCSCPVLLLSQISREAVERPPQLNDLYESGRIEMDADVVMFLYRLAYYWDADRYDREYEQHKEWHKHYDHFHYPANRAEIIVDKQRQGGMKRKVLHLQYNSQYGYKGIAHGLD